MVLIHEAVNDVEPRAWPGFRADYSHYRRFEAGRFPPGTDEPFGRNVRTIAEHVRLRGGRPVLTTMPYDPERAKGYEIHRAGIEEHNTALRELASQQGFDIVDLDGR